MIGYQDHPVYARAPSPSVMFNDTVLRFDFLAACCTRVAVAFHGGRIRADGGVMLSAVAERRIGIAATRAPLESSKEAPPLATMAKWLARQAMSTRSRAPMAQTRILPFSACRGRT